MFRICSPVKEILGHLIVVGEELVTKLLHLVLPARAHLLKMEKKKRMNRNQNQEG